VTPLDALSGPGRPSDQATWFGQPRGLTVLFLTEMWEKFSFFGMRALLVYYMTKQLMMGQQQASLIYGLYSGLVYFTPILGGAISDRWIGRRNAIILGGSIMAVGHFMMASEPLFYPALATIALGNGLFLPSLPSQIGDLYPPGDPRRGSAYSVYYVGINLGAFLAPLVCGTVGETLGWHWGFAIAGAGMVLGLLIYVAGRSHLPPAQVASAAATASAPPGGSVARLRMLAGITLAVMVFRVAYEQTGNTVAVWADGGIDRHLGPGTWVIPMTWFQALNPLLVFTLTPPLVAYWKKAARAGREPAVLVKMATGAGVAALAFLLLAGVSLWSSQTHCRPSWIWLAVFFIVLTAGELFILPIGLGLFGRLAPPRMAATTIALWFLAAFAGNLLAGAVGMLWSHVTPAAFFALMAAIAGLAGLLLRLFDGPVRAIDARHGAESSPNLSEPLRTPCC
jgi:POT family proton-dependent oligopeptide transporter